MIEFDEEVATKFTNTFEECQETVWGLTVIAIEEQIVKVIGLLVVGEHYPNENDVRLARAQFTLPGDPPLEITKKGFKIMSIPLPYDELAMHIIRYFTYEGIFYNLYAHYFKLHNPINHKENLWHAPKYTQLGRKIRQELWYPLRMQPPMLL